MFPVEERTAAVPLEKMNEEIVYVREERLNDAESCMRRLKFEDKTLLSLVLYVQMLIKIWIVKHTHEFMR